MCLLNQTATCPKGFDDVHTFDLGIFDEAHKTVGLKDKLFSRLLYEKNIKIQRRVFMTATERQYRGDSDNVDSMDDINVYGDTFDKMTFKEALDEKNPILCDYKIVTTIITRSDIQQLVDQNFLVKPDKGKWDSETEAKTLASLIALKKVMKKYKANHALTFHNSIAKAKAFSESVERFDESVKGYGKTDTYHVSSNVSTAKRNVELNRFADSKKAVVTNARCLTEGVDIPKIDVILFTDPKRSTVDIVQAAGRALRPAEGKKKGYIVVPVIVDPEDPDNTDEAYQEILMVLRAMASNDDRIIEYFRTVNQGKKSSKKIDIVDIEIADPRDIELQNFVDSIKDKAWNRLAKLSWRPFEEARYFVQQLNLSGQNQWRKYLNKEFSEKPEKPYDIPTNPERVYKNFGWIGYGDWFGTKQRRSSKHFSWREFTEAREIVHKLNLKHEGDWRKYTKGELLNLKSKPIDIPANPMAVYKDKGWISIGDWLGTGRVADKLKEWREFTEAREFARNKNILTAAKWIAWAKTKERPSDIPASPQNTYKDKGWVAWYDWLGTKNKQGGWREFSEAREFARSLSLASAAEWRAYCKDSRPFDIPAKPYEVYKEDWSDWQDWLGYEAVKIKPKNEWCNFNEAKNFVQNLGLENVSEWQDYCKSGDKPKDIPATPEKIYTEKHEWVSYGDWLGTGRIADGKQHWRSFKKARSFVHTLHLKNQKEWQEYSKSGNRPDDIPSTPASSYKDKGWMSWGDWIGTKNTSNKSKKDDFLSYDDAKGFVHCLKLKSTSEWNKYKDGNIKKLERKPENIPKDPRSAYKDKGWVSMQDWLGKE